MTIQDDETLQMYLEESLEHLADIENDFLAIEENGANIDEDLVNKVYRAAHSIKGGAGFMGLNNIKELTHEMENILGKIRAGEMVPTPDIVNVLLDASDQLKALMNDVLNSNDVDISIHVKALQEVLAGRTPPAEEAPTTETTASAAAETTDSPVAAEGKTVEVETPDGHSILTPSAEALAEAHADGKCVYLVHLDMAADITAQNRSLAELLTEMDQTGSILASSVTLPPIATIDAQWSCGGDTLALLFATILKPGDINVLFGINPANILQLTPNQQLLTLEGAPAGGEPTMAAATESVEDTSAATSAASAVPETASEPVPEEVRQPEPTIPESAMATPQKNMSGTKPVMAEQETSLRVHVSLLDQLMTLAGELVLSRNQLLQSMTSDDHRASEIAGQRIDLITSELQEAIMLTRMQSIGNVFNKFPRVVRDLARSLGKKVELTLEGKDVELDKTIIEAIGDPLTHLVRNAVDHGIESPETRRKNRKPEVGQIYLKAYHEAGQVNIEIADDGKGLDGELIAQKAIEKGLITEDQAKVLSDKDQVNLIFLPGFSTAEKVTDVSGRGVGMDVVKTNLDKLGGLIDIESEAGKGSTIRIKLPLTLAIIPCQVVYTGGERYAIPQVNLEELLRIPADQVRDRIERVGDAEVVRLRGDLLPLVKLADIIGVKPLYHDPKTNTYRPDRRQSITDARETKTALFTDENETVPATDVEPASAEVNPSETAAERRFRAASALNIVVVSTGTMKYGLVVDELHDSEEIVVKPLGRDLKKCRGYAGATIMGDGRVALILDVSNLARMAGLTSVESSIKARELQAAESILRQKSDRQSLLIFRSAEEEQFAAPLNLVERIEKIKASDIEEVGGKRVMQYRGGSLPLFSIDEAAMVKPLAPSDNLLVIVFIVAGREVGLLAIGPVDAMETGLDVDGTTLKQTGIMGSAIINDHTTLLIDMYEIVQTLNPEWFEEQSLPQEEGVGSYSILFAEDSNFFRNQVKGSMEEEGYNVIEAEDGAEAWDLLQQNGDEIGLVVTDIEMPNMNGFDLTRRIKGHPAFGHLPVIALTTLAGEEDVARGKEVGIDDYQIKLDREKLLKSIYEHLQAVMA
ncbi:MAG: chemotaxis protein CheW [Desulfosarcinaceae bacterium]|nr:chemotaxis protein CheW [Desulfosarcinaceae bacterium]